MKAMHSGFGLAALVLAALSCSPAVALDSNHGGAPVLRDGAAYDADGKLLIAGGPRPVTAVTISPNGRHVVFVRQGVGQDGPTMWIRDRRTGRDLQVGRGLGRPCCTLASDAGDPARVSGKFERVHGAYWSGSRRVLVRFVGMVTILSMDGSLQGDV